MAFRLDESDPQLLIVYPGTDHTVDDYEQMLRHWASRFEGDGRFGVMVVNEPHDHDHDHDDEEARVRNEEQEARLIKLINDFRRDYRMVSNQKTIGFANVYDPSEEWVKERGEEGWEQLQMQAMMRANYMFGTRGRNFTDLAEAKAWLKEQAKLPPIEIDDVSDLPVATSKRVGLFYGSTTGVTEQIAYEIRDLWSNAGLGDLQAINITNLDDIGIIQSFDDLMLGTPTWNIGQLQDDWENEFPNLEKLDLTGKRIALFGAGDQEHYAENFQDALGILGRELRKSGAMLVGFTSTDSYDYEDSLGVENGQFMGLAIDEVNQPEMTTNRIQNWVKQLVSEFELTPA